MNSDVTQSISEHIIGIGGVFFRSKNPEKLTDWYKENLGFSVQVPFYDNDTAISFKWKSFDGSPQATVWAPFDEQTSYFDPSTKQLMINYIVENIEGLMSKLKQKEIEQVGEILVEEYGKFAWILDPEGNKIEFWEPNKDFFKNIF